MRWALRYAAAVAAALIAAPLLSAAADEVPKRGGTLTYVIPADAPPSFDGHRESTYATVQGFAPFYSLLIKVDPNDPGSPNFICALCTAMPEPTDGGTTSTFKIRRDVKFHDGSSLTAADVVASWNHIISPPQGVLSPRQGYFLMVDKLEATDPETV